MTDQQKLAKWSIIQDMPGSKIVIARTNGNPFSIITLWKGADYDNHIGYTLQQAQARILELV